VLIKDTSLSNNLRAVNSAVLIIVDVPDNYQGKCTDKILGRKLKDFFLKLVIDGF